MALMHIENLTEVFEYEIDQKDFDFTNSENITKGTFNSASWRGIHVAVKMLGEKMLTDEDEIKAFRDKLSHTLLLVFSRPMNKTSILNLSESTFFSSST